MIVRTRTIAVVMHLDKERTHLEAGSEHKQEIPVPQVLEAEVRMCMCMCVHVHVHVCACVYVGVRL